MKNKTKEIRKALKILTAKKTGKAKRGKPEIENRQKSITEILRSKKRMR